MSTRARYGRPMRFRVLGPLEVDAGDGPLPLGGPKQRAVLANLLIRANQVVPADILIDAVWGEVPPEKARNTLQTYVSNLRKSLGDGRLEGRPPGYVLLLEPFELDASRFDALLRDAKKQLPVDPGVALADLDDALALWRGPALADLGDQPSLLAEAARLNELRIEAQEDRIEGLLSIGDQATAIGALELLLADHLLRERLWALLMLALYREGRQAEALGAYQRAREILADELGIDPSPGLTRLQERILKQDPGLDLRGEPLRGYRLLEKIGQGAVGTVFRAIQPHVGRDVAVKVVHERFAADPEFVRRFEPEAQAVSALEHPHVAPIYDYWREPGRAYVVTRYLRGGTLDGLEARAEPLEPERARRVVEQIASALAFAHRQGITHGDVRASNVLFDAEGNAYLCDFAIGVDEPVERAEDVRALARLSRRLLGDAPSDPVAVLAESVEAGAELDAGAFVATARGIVDATDIEIPVLAQSRNPYKGLRPYGEADARDFSGRGELTQRLLARLNEPGRTARFLAVVGPSGCGKSSVVRAGLIPAIRQGALAGTGSVSVAEMFPGAQPIDELEAALLRVAVRPVARVRDHLIAGSRGLLETIDLVLPGDGEVVLVVDQLEELFTLTTDEGERELFLESLRVAVADPASRLRVIATLRADFYDRPLAYPRFGELLATRTEAVPPLTPDELEQAIREPVERVGVRPDPGLVAEMIADVAHEPGALPLLQYALTELFERREEDRLTLPAYQGIGGVAGALSTRADEIYRTTELEGRRAIRQVFLRLVTLGEGRQDTRRRVARSELDGLEVGPGAVDGVLEAFGTHRFLTFDREPATREPTVEIGHEALLTAWERFRDWIDEAREDLRHNLRLTRAATEWNGSGENPSFLLRGVRLEQLETWAQATGFALGKTERGYLKESLEQRDREHGEERARLEREREVERRSRRRLQGLVAVFAVAALVAGSLTIVATSQSDRAEREARVARARELAAAAIANLEEDPERSVLLAIEAVKVTRSIDGSVSPEARDALHRAITASRIDETVPGVGPPIAMSSAGVFAAQVADEPGVIDIRDSSSGEPVLTFRAHPRIIRDVAFSADGDLLATAGNDGTLRLWDPATGEPVSTVRGAGRVSGVSFDGDGTLVSASWGDEKTIRVVEARTGRTTTTLPFGAKDTSLSPDGRWIAFVDTPHNGKVRVVDVVTGEDRFGRISSSTKSVTTYPIGSVAWSPDGKALATVSASALDIWHAGTGTIRATSFRGPSHQVEWSLDSTRLVTVGAVWEVDRASVEPVFWLRSLATREDVGDVAISPDGSRVSATAYHGASVAIWDAGTQGDAEWANLPAGLHFGDVAFLPNGHLLAVDADRRLTEWNQATGRPLRRFGPDVREHRLHVSADGRSIAIPEYTAGISTWDVPSGERLFGRLNAGSLEGQYAGWSPDGKLLAMSRFVDGRGSFMGTPGTTIVDREGRTIRSFGTGRDAWGTRFSPDGRLLGVVSAGATGPKLVLRDWRRRTIVGEIPARSDRPFAFDADGARVVLVGRTDVPEVWDLETHERVSQLLGGTPFTCSLAFSPDGSLVAVGGDDGAVRVYDADSGKSILVLRGHTRAVCGVAFSPDGRMLASHGLGLVRVWAMDIDDLLRIGRENVTRELTTEECRQYLRTETCEAA